MADKDKYLILDKQGKPLAGAEGKTTPQQKTMVLTVDESALEMLLSQEYVQLVSSASHVAPVEARILGGRGDRLEVEKLRSIDDGIRQNLRMPVRFLSYLYPLSGLWDGRREIVSHDLSCGGIAFYSRQQLREGEKVEIVVPITSEPLVLRARILRQKNTPAGIFLYAAAFDNLTPGEEAMVREAVFSLQIDAVG